MGYRSDVVLAVAFETLEQMQEVLAVYAMDPLVQKHNIMQEWRIDDYYPRMAYCAESVKWYPEFEDVQAIRNIETVAEEFANKREFDYGVYYLRYGENPDDIEEVCSGSAMDLARTLSDLVTVYHSIEVDI
jgi:hypothetical protein